MSHSFRARVLVTAALQVLLLIVLVGVGGYLWSREQATQRALDQVFDAQSTLQTLIRSFGEVLITEGSSSSLALANKSLERLARSVAESDGQGAPNASIRNHWAQIQPLATRFLSRKKYSVDDVEVMTDYGKLSELGGRLVSAIDEVAVHAAELQSAAERLMLWAIGFALAAFAAVLAGGSWMLVRSISRPIQQVVALTQEIASGDVRATVPGSDVTEMRLLMQAMTLMQESIVRTLSAIGTATQGITRVSADIATGSGELARRTNQQSSELQSSVGAIVALSEGLEGTVALTRDTNNRVVSAMQAARQGSEAVRAVVSTMQEIQSNSRRVADITGVIDGIAFQTNILALNAAVEAARAGEQGRGFAVVASEVRTLAKRSADAAREIKSLLTAAGERVDAGSTQVADAGAAMGEIEQVIKSINDLIHNIDLSANDQSTRLQEVTRSLRVVESAAEQNSSLVAQSTTAAAGLEELAANLVGTLGRYRV